MKMYKETRYLHYEDVRLLCIAHGYYTSGTEEEYNAMLNRCGVVREKDIIIIGLDIAKHSESAYRDFLDETGLFREDFKCRIMHQLACITHSHFEPI